MQPEKFLEYKEGDVADVLTEEPGCTNIVMMTIDVCGAVPIGQKT